ncbi:MAG TPA: DUF2207 domain-containing protein [Polyangiales bacterium]|nr:DUF2207 domain-containing protein [Polyangiales bacterium]
MRRASAWLIAALVCGAAAPGVASADKKELHWNAFTVDAFLDADGALHVSERHAIVFSGDWNGAERVFGLKSGQSLELERVARVDPTSGALRPLTAGGLQRVDQYDYSRSNMTLRWRSRLASDPVFDRTEIVYVIEYVLYGVLWSSGDALLVHDFAFGRTSTIDAVSVQLRVDPSWRPRTKLDGALTRSALPANEPLIVEASFDLPGRLKHRRSLLLVVLLLAPLALVLGLLAYERWRGRLAPIEELDAQGLEHELLQWKPELVAVLWNAWDPPGRNAVAALLARMVLEHRIATRDRQGQLELELCVARDALEGHERQLVDGLFFAGDVSSAQALEEHYRARGFTPRAYLRPLLAERDRLLGSRWPRWALIGPVLALLLAGVVASLLAPGEAALRTAVVCALSSLPALVGAVVAAHWRSRLALELDAAAGFVVPALLPPLGAVEAVWLDGGMMFLAELGVASIALAFCAGVIASAASNETREGLALRRRLTAIRAALARALNRHEQLPEAIVPYLLALDLPRYPDSSNAEHAWVGQLRRLASGVATPWAPRESRAA